MTAPIHRFARAAPTRLPLCLVVFLCFAPTACGAEQATEAPRQAAAADTVARVTQHTREILFVGDRDQAPLAVPFVFNTSVAAEGRLRRSVHAWVAHGPEWSGFLDEGWTTSDSGGVWRIVPHGDLRVLAGGAGELEALVFRRGDRSLRLAPEILRSTWTPNDETQFRLYEGWVEVGGQRTRGSVLESYRVQRMASDALVTAGAVDWLFVTDGGTVNVLASEALGADSQTLTEKTFAWTVLPDGERSWDVAEVRWMEMQPVEPARRDVPVSWTVRIPGSGVEGEVYSTGYDLQLGPDRPGRRAVLLRHTVEGWVSVGGERYRVIGLLRHSQG